MSVNYSFLGVYLINYPYLLMTKIFKKCVRYPFSLLVFREGDGGGGGDGNREEDVKIGRWR
jgi:hypothetical protein